MSDTVDTLVGKLQNERQDLDISGYNQKEKKKKKVHFLTATPKMCRFTLTEKNAINKKY